MVVRCEDEGGGEEVEGLEHMLACAAGAELALKQDGSREPHVCMLGFMWF